jgi:hypothetical protein
LHNFIALGNSNTLSNSQAEQKPKDLLFNKKQNEASTWKSKTAGLSTDYRNELNENDQDNFKLNQSLSKKDSFMIKDEKVQLSNKNEENLKSTTRKSPRDSLEDNELKESLNKTTFLKNVNILGSLISKLYLIYK